MEEKADRLPTQTAALPFSLVGLGMNAKAQTLCQLMVKLVCATLSAGISVDCSWFARLQDDWEKSRFAKIDSLA